jgi:dipeptidyl aminopeptidase/acylaminoacyl peptidase
VDQILASLGKPAGTDAPEVQHVKDSTVVAIPVHWRVATLNFIVSWNTAQQVEGTWFLTPSAERRSYQTASYSQPSKFSGREVTIGDDEWKLPGTLLVPKGKGPFPAVVLVHGSGPQDRDETIGGAKVFRDLAEGLATRGIAVLRYDKRNFAHRTECINDRNFDMNRETVDDAVRAAALLRREAGIDPRSVFMLGHSQGGYMAPRIMQADPKLAGVILLAGNVRPLEELIVEQSEYLFRLGGGPTAAQQAQLNELKRDPWQALIGVPESYRADLKNYKPVDLARSSQVPMLILQGERDYQVTMKDFALWKAGLAGRASVTLHSFPALNHLFIAGEGKSGPQEYEQTGHVAAEVIDTIANWVAGEVRP